MTLLNSTLDFNYTISQGYGYVLKAKLPSVVSSDGRRYQLIHELRSEALLWGRGLNLSRAVPAGTTPIPLPGAPGPEFEYALAKTNFGTLALAQADAALEQSAFVALLNGIVTLNCSIPAEQLIPYDVQCGVGVIPI